MNKIIITSIFVVLIIYCGYLGLFLYSNKHFSYDDVDLDKNHILTFSELGYFSNIGFMYKCLPKKSSNNLSMCKTLEVEIFSLKDGLTLKKEQKTDACCIFALNKKASYQSTGKVIFWDNKIVKPMVSKSWQNRQIIVGLKENHSGYFIVDKTQMKLYDGLTKKNCSNLLRKYKIAFKEIKWNEAP